MDDATFYDDAKVAIMPMGMCYPGVLPRGGDRPPAAVCAPSWHHRIRPLLAGIRLTLLVGGYAQAAYLGPGPMTGRVRDFASFLPDTMPLPHPSWRTIGWARRNPWFEADALPALRARVADALV